MLKRRPRRVHALALVAAFLVPLATTIAAEYDIDSAQTFVTFEVRNLGIFAQRGTFNSATGTVAFDAPAGSGHLEILLDARTLQADSPELENFMRGERLLDVEQHPQIAYRSERIVFADGQPRRIEGDLTLLGVTRPVSLAITRNDCVRRGNSHNPCTMAATARFKRSAFGMTNYLALVSDEVTLVVYAVAVPQSGAGLP